VGQNKYRLSQMNSRDVLPRVHRVYVIDRCIGTTASSSDVNKASSVKVKVKVKAVKPRPRAMLPRPTVQPTEKSFIWLN